MEALELGRQAHAKGMWADAYEQLTRADASLPLGGQDLELLASAAYLVGHNDECLRALERAHQSHLDAENLTSAARCAFWLGFNLASRGELGPATGWLGRAQRLVDRHGGDCVELGYLLLPDVVMKRLAGDHEGAGETAATARAIGERFAEDDLVAYALHEQGRALLKEGSIDEGLALLDEAMVAVTSGELSPLVTGLIYCSVIEACREVYELRRAHEWTAALTRWCADQHGMVTYTGQCSVHWAQIMNLRGQWEMTLDEARRAAERFGQGIDQQAAGAAFYEQAEVYRLRGDLDLAEKTYQRAREWGMEPQPGLSLLRLAQGRLDAAIAAVRRALMERTERLERARLLPAFVEIALACGDIDAARRACAELDEIAGGLGTSMIDALASRARGAVALADGDPEAALSDLRRSWRTWSEIEAPYEAARTRVMLGLACRELGDFDTGDLELEAAKAVFEKLGAQLDPTAPGPALRRRNAHGLTARELEVLKLVAEGLTNKAIASRLVLSERTVDRHVSNILSKIGAASRAAATAYAYEHQLV